VDLECLVGFEWKCLRNAWRGCGILSNEDDCNILGELDVGIILDQDFLTLMENGDTAG
jgi:hypothetical protein